MSIPVRSEYTPEKVAELVATANAMREQLGEDYPKVGSILDLWLRTADTLESVYADSLTAQAEHARWQERAEKAERAGERILADALARSAELRQGDDDADR